jgi:hypothetical protein
MREGLEEMERYNRMVDEWYDEKFRRDVERYRSKIGESEIREERYRRQDYVEIRD